MFQLLYELVRKDLKVFVSDRKAMIISFAVPVVIASFMAMLFGNTGNASSANGPQVKSKISVAVVDEDHGNVSKDFVDRLQKNDSLQPFVTDRATAKKWVNEGRASFGFVIPSGFSKQSVAAMQGNGASAPLEKMSDPSKSTEAAVAEGISSRVLASAVVKATYGEVPGASDRTAPFEFKEAPKPAGSESQQDATKTSGIAHAFAGMAIQGLLFWSIEAAMSILRERRQGIWRRMRAAPVTPFSILLGKVLSGSVRALMIMAVVFGAGAILFHIRVAGSFVGFGLVALASSFMAATFGLFVAALGKTEQQSRGLSILAVLSMLMLGGAWFPSFLMPSWFQSISMLVPVHWAVDGFDAMIWRAQGLTDSLRFAGVLVCFSLVFGVIALKRIKWEYEA